MPVKAEFEARRVYGTLRFYPRNKTAALLVALKRSIAPPNRRRAIKCLNQKEIKIVQKLGIDVVLSVESKL